MRTDLVSAGIIGVMVGIGVGLVVLPWSTPVLVQASRPVTPVDAAEAEAPEPCPQADAARARVDLRRLEIAAAEARIGTLHQERTAIAGEPISWPDDIDPAVGPDGAEGLLREVAAAGGARLLGVECEEFPCVGTLAVDMAEGASFGAVQDAIRDGADEVLGQHGATLWSNAGVRGLPDGSHLLVLRVEVVPAEGYERTGELSKRVAFRSDALSKMLVEEELERILAGE